VDGLKSFSPTDSDPKAVQRRTHWLANELDQEAISTEDQVALTAVLGATHIHEAKMELYSGIQHLRDDYLTVRNDLLDAQHRISKLEDLVRIITLQQTAAANSPKLAQRMELTSANGQTLDLSVPKGKALVPLTSSRTPNPAPSATDRPHRDGERMRLMVDDHLRNLADAFEQAAMDDKLRLQAVQEAVKASTRLEETVELADRSRIPVASDANEVKDEVVSEHGSELSASASVQAAASTDKQLHKNTFTGNDKPLPPVPAAQAFPQSDVNRNAGKRKYTPTDVDPDPWTMAQKETVPSFIAASAATFDSSPPSAATFGLATPVPAAAQTPQAVSSVRSKGKMTKWKDPPIFQDNEPTSAPNSFQFSVSAPAFNASGQCDVSTGHDTENQKPTSQISQHPDPQQTPSKTSTSNENTRQLGSIVKVLQENKKLGEDKLLQKKPERTPIFASADAMMNMVKSIAPDSGYVVSPKPVVVAASQAAVPRALSVPSPLPTAAPTLASRTDSAPSSDGSVSKSSSLEVPAAPSKKKKSVIKLVKPETELVLPTTASPSATSSLIKQEKPTKASLPGSSTGPATPPASAVTSIRASTSPSTVTTSSPLTPAQAPTIKVTQAKKAMAASASAPAFTPLPSKVTASSSSTSPSPKKEMAIPESLRKQMTPGMLAMLSGNLKCA
jgi:hypothetical protein